VRMGAFAAKGVRVGVVNVQGRVFMRHTSRSPFLSAERAIHELEDDGVDLVLVDVHAEATSEKQAMGYYLAGKAQVVV
jgi:calcineurin-like phosphoesterase